MPPSLQQSVEKAIALLPKRSVFKNGQDEFELRNLFPVQAWKPHTEACRAVGSLVFGEDSGGNFFLLAPDGLITFWDHETNEETVLAQTIDEFLGGLVEPTPVVLNPEDVISSWIDPEFLAEQKKKGNA